MPSKALPREPSEDSQLLAAARDGDVAALERLLAAVGAEVRKALDIGPQWQSLLDPDDVMQVTYLEAFTRFDRFLGKDSAALRTWLQRIAKSNLLDAIRALDREKRPSPRKRVQPLDSRDGQDGLEGLMGIASKTPGRIAAAAEARHAIHEALSRLPDPYAEVLRLFDLEGLTGPQVAERLGCSRVTAFMLRARARDALRDALGTASRFLSP